MVGIQSIRKRERERDIRKERKNKASFLLRNRNLLTISSFVRTIYIFYFFTRYIYIYILYIYMYCIYI